MAMSAQELQDRITKKEAAIEKIRKRIDKWSKGMNEEAVELCKIFETVPYGTAAYKTAYQNYRAYSDSHENDPTVNSGEYGKAPDIGELYSAYRDLGDSLITLNKYKNALTLEQDKAEKPVIQIFKEFFDNWKNEIIEFVTPLVDEYYKVNSEIADFHNNRWLHLQHMSQEEYKQKARELREQEREIESISWVRIAIDKGFKWRDDDFKKYLDKYMLDRYYELVDKVTAITGEIKDVSNLSIGRDGSINGIIKGELADAKIETIVAGGYNEHQIVNVKHGQCRHYRVLVHKL